MGKGKTIEASDVTDEELREAMRAVRPGEPLTVLRDGVERMQIVIPGPLDPDPDWEEGFALGCIVGAAIVAWGDAMRGMVRFREHRRYEAYWRAP